jgi:hypothetical protein
MKKTTSLRRTIKQKKSRKTNKTRKTRKTNKKVKGGKYADSYDKQGNDYRVSKLQPYEQQQMQQDMERQMQLDIQRQRQQEAQRQREELRTRRMRMELGDLAEPSQQGDWTDEFSQFVTR